MKKHKRIHIGLRTAKTAAAVIISMLIVELYGATSSKLIFAMLGAMAAVQTTFKASVESCLTQIIGVLFGAIAGILLIALPIPGLVSAGIGIVLVITLYNALNIRFSPSLPCFIVVMICTTEEIHPFAYALGRIWDTAIGLGVGMLINTLVFPYDNSRQIRSTAESLDREVITFLEQMFDGDDILPDANTTARKIAELERQLSIFSNQKLLLKLKRQKEDLAVFQSCERKAKVLVARMEVLCHIDQPGRLNAENRRRLEQCGANIQDSRILDTPTELDTVTNYHVTQLLNIRQELMEVLSK